MSQVITDTKDLDKKFTVDSFIGCEDDQREADLLRRQYNANKDFIDKRNANHLKSWQRPAEQL